MEYRAILEGPRWARCDKFAKDVAFWLGIECEVERETSWAREKVRIVLRGNDAAVMKAAETIDASVKAYNK